MPYALPPNFIQHGCQRGWFGGEGVVFCLIVFVVRKGRNFGMMRGIVVAKDFQASINKVRLLQRGVFLLQQRKHAQFHAPVSEVERLFDLARIQAAFKLG